MSQSNTSKYTVSDIAMPFFAGVVIVFTPIPVNAFALVLWIALVTRNHLRARSPRNLFLQIATLGAVVIAATFAPLKTVDRFLDREVTLPSARMRLGDFHFEEFYGDKRKWFPTQVSIGVPENERDNILTFVTSTPTLREFIEAVEKQSSLRHRFSHCGNGYTILHGGDCSFGLSFRSETAQSDSSLD